MVVDVWGSPFEVPMEQLVAMVLELAELEQKQVAEAVPIHQKVEHPQGQVEFPQVVYNGPGYQVHPLHILDLAVDARVFHQQILQSPLQVLQFVRF